MATPPRSRSCAYLTRQITGGGGDNIALGERFRDRGFKHGAIDDFPRLRPRTLAARSPCHVRPDQADAILARGANDLSPDDREHLFAYYLAAVAAEWPKNLEALKSARQQANAAVDGLREIMVMREMPQPKKAYVLFRGQYDQRRDEVHAGAPAVLPPMSADLPRNRLGLARWLTNRGHPLTARVAVNRFWQSLFGRGLVKTAEDFGSQGSPPSHPELLDWLALHFIDSGWDVKGLMKTIVMSQTHRQRSVADAKLMADDPENEWLARGPRFRLSAEMIRDNAASSAGLINLRLGGPPVNPYEMSESFKPESPSGGAECIVAAYTRTGVARARRRH